jgi:DNA-binding response OmpR family regulator
MRVLLVSADPAVERGVRGALGDAAMTHVSRPEAALELLDEGERYDVVVADADTVPTGGYALSREVKAREQMGRDMPPVVILITRADDRWIARWSRPDAYVRKPVDPFDLAEVVVAVAEGRPVPALPGVKPGPAGLPEGEPTEADLQASGGLTGGAVAV